MTSQTPSDWQFNQDHLNEAAKQALAERERIQQVKTPMVEKPPTLREILESARRIVARRMSQP